MTEPIAPHGGTLVNRLVAGDERDELRERAHTLPHVLLGPRQVSDLEMIAVGAMSPLTGFMGEADYQAVLDTRRLDAGLPWTLPVTLPVAQEAAESMRVGQQVALLDGRPNSRSAAGQPGAEAPLLAVLTVEEKFAYSKDKEARQIYSTEDLSHPGVAALKQQGDVYLAGPLHVTALPAHDELQPYRMTPEETRGVFRKRGWRRIVGFQTRNPVHRAHEYIQKCALETVDALLLHPLVGETKSDDLPAAVRIKSYELLLDKYYPTDRVLLAVFPATMRYAGPREAIFHALVRKNYGCTHFIVGRDHAGVGSFYGSFDAHYIFDEFEPEEIGITPLFFDYTFYCTTCDSMASDKTCPHPSDAHVTLSGTKVRELLREGTRPPAEFTRPEIADLLIDALTQTPKYSI